MSRRVQLHGGPLDGQEVSISEANHGERRVMLLVPGPEQEIVPWDDMLPIGPGPTYARYEAQLWAAGRRGTAAYREWYHWTYQP